MTIYTHSPMSNTLKLSVKPRYAKVIETFVRG